MNDDYCYKASIAKLLLLVANRGKVDDYRNGQGPVADPENFGGGDLKPKPQKFACLHQN